MATANFSVENATKIFVIDFEDRSIPWEFIKDDIKEGLNESFDGFGLDDSYEGMNGYPLGRVDFDIFHGNNLGFTINFYLELKSGYYADANIDYKVVIGGLDHDMFLEDIMEDEDAIDMVADGLEYHYDTRGMCKMQAKHIANKLQKKIPELQEQVEKELHRIADSTMVVAGRFSNGEAIYESI